MFVPVMSSDLIEVSLSTENKKEENKERIIPVGGSFGYEVSKALNDIFSKNNGLPDPRLIHSLGEDLDDVKEKETMYTISRQDVLDDLGEKKEEVLLSVESLSPTDKGSAFIYDIGEEIFNHLSLEKKTVILAESYLMLDTALMDKVKKLIEEDYTVTLILIVDKSISLQEIEFKCKDLCEVMQDNKAFRLYASYIVQ